MSLGGIENCPKCRERLWADGSTPDGRIFFGMATAGYCPKCGKFYDWDIGKPVPEEYSHPSEIRIAVDGEEVFSWKEPSFIERIIDRTVKIINSTLDSIYQAIFILIAGPVIGIGYLLRKLLSGTAKGVQKTLRRFRGR
ncbi:MAG: hypothetical protein QXQ02_09115 [Halobacteria archaeon]